MHTTHANAFHGGIHPADREHSDGRIPLETSHKPVRDEIDLELAVSLSAHQIAYPDDFGIQTV